MEFSDKERLRLQRFLKPADGGCLIFTGRLNFKGYGEFRLRGRTDKAHRVAFLMAGGVLSTEKPCVLHTCDVPSCCEPSHLWAGTKRDNVEDMLAKGRGQASRHGWPFGVSPAGGKFKVAVRINGEHRYFGVHSSVEAAADIAAFVKNVATGKAFLAKES